MSDSENIRLVPTSTLNFDNAPVFCENGNPAVNGKGVRVTAGMTTGEAGKETVQATGDGVFLKIQDGSVMFFATDDFNAHFSRSLSNGEQVKLSKPVSVQLAEIRHAEDATHLKDLGMLTGAAALENVVDFVGGLTTKAANSETGKQVRQAAGDFKGEMGAAYKDAKEGLKSALNSPKAQDIRNRVKGLMWGKLRKGKDSTNG
jgi:hypothetical protein